MRLTTVAVVALLVCAAVAPSAMALGTPTTERHGSATGADLTERAGFSLQTGSASDSTTTGSNQSNSSLGVRVSSFVHSTSTETAGVVDNEMWAADVNRAQRPEAVDKRITRIREQLSTVQTQRAELRAAYRAGELSRLQYQSRLAQLNGQLTALSVGTDVTERTATRLGTDPKGLTSVREDLEDIRETRGRENPGVARGASGQDEQPTTDGNESATDSVTSGVDGASADETVDTGNTTTTASALKASVPVERTA